MSTHTARKRSSRRPRQRWKPREYGPPKVLAFCLILFVLLGGAVFGVWSVTHAKPQVQAKSVGQEPKQTP